jgi:uncharacterized protein YndB with AHSA1/START domain
MGMEKLSRARIAGDFELERAGSGTELTLKHERFADEDARNRHVEGWTGCIERLQRLLDAG